MAHSITFEDRATVVLVWVDDWYPCHGVRCLEGKVGAKPVFRDSEVMTLLLLMDFLPFPGETQFLAFLRANYLSLLPRLLSQSQFHRRARSLSRLVEERRRHGARALGATCATLYLRDTKPLPVVGYKRDKSRSDFTATADYGVCASRHLKYFGYQRVLLCTWEGVPAAYDLVPASTDERVAGDQVLDCLWQAQIIGDKGFMGEDWQRLYRETRPVDILTPYRAHQPSPHAPRFTAWLPSVRTRMEGAFHEVQNTGRHREHLRCRTLRGLITHVMAKMTSHTLKLLLRREAGIDVQTFTVITYTNSV